MVPVVAAAAAAVGVAAIFVEAHDDPDHAPSDGPNMLPIGEVEGLVRKLVALDRIAKSSTPA
jgi:2-dehydro-3-deoxyphosphooctonate aldolase (KDO 8-P synthase)